MDNNKNDSALSKPNLNTRSVMFPNEPNSDSSEEMSPRRRDFVRRRKEHCKNECIAFKRGLELLAQDEDDITERRNENISNQNIN